VHAFADTEISIQPICANCLRWNSASRGARGTLHSWPRQTDEGQNAMKKHLKALRTNWANKQQGGMGYVLLWLLGVPIPVLILISLLRGCN
jgi:hypothetical protein